MGVSDIGIQHGATVAYDSVPGAGSYDVALGKVVGIKPPAPTKDVHDKTHLGSPGTYKEKFTGLKDTDDATVRIKYTEAGWTAALTLFDLGETGIQITSAQGSTMVWTGEATKLDPPELVDGEMEFTITLIRTTGAPTWTE